MPNSTTLRPTHPEDAEIAEIGVKITELHHRRMDLMEAVAFREMIQNRATALLLQQRESLQQR